MTVKRTVLNISFTSQCVPGIHKLLVGKMVSRPASSICCSYTFILCYSIMSNLLYIFSLFNIFNILWRCLNLCNNPCYQSELLRVVVVFLFIYLSKKKTEYLPCLGYPSCRCSGKESACQCRRFERHSFDPCIRKIPWKRQWQPTPVFLPREFHG